MKIITIIGARPQFIKSSMISKEIANYPEIEEIIIHTGQHFDKNMSDIFFKDMMIRKPDYNLGINNLSHGAMTGRTIEAVEKILLSEKPDKVLVFGDTNTTLAGALASAKLNIPVSHVEAGLRSFNKCMPEEINRILTDHISDILFVPTDNAVNNLHNEGIRMESVFKVGDVMYDSALYFEGISNSKSRILRKYILKNNKFVLCTIHRQENTDNKKRLFNIVQSLKSISEKVKIILPIHPRTQAIFKKLNIKFSTPNIIIISPIGYLDMLALLKSCKLVITDSGGLQKEAYFYKKYCLTIRDETEWIELVEKGYNFIVGTNPQNILSKFNNIKNTQFIDSSKLFGDGKTRKKIVKILLEE